MDIIVRGVTHAALPPRRRIYIAEVARAMADARERAFAACLGLACRSLWGPTGAKDENGKPVVRVEPKYTGDAASYGADVYEILSDAGWTHSEIVLAGLEAWKTWAPLAVPEAAVKEAEDFTDRPAEATSDSAATSS